MPAVFALAAASTGVHAGRVLSHALADGTTQAWLLALHAVLRTSIALAFAVFTVGRSAPRSRANSPLGFIACTAALTAVIAFAEPHPSTPGMLVLAGDLLTAVSCAWLLVAVLSLGRCFGILPEARGLVVTGPYRFVRHPVYLGELGACMGLTIAAPTTGNAALLGAFVLAQATRMLLEEKALTQAFPDYAGYAADTPRLLPPLRLLRITRVASSTRALAD